MVGGRFRSTEPPCSNSDGGSLQFLLKSDWRNLLSEKSRDFVCLGFERFQVSSSNWNEMSLFQLNDAGGSCTNVTLRKKQKSE